MKRFYFAIALMAFVVVSSLFSELYLKCVEKQIFTQLEKAELVYQENTDEKNVAIEKAYRIWESKFSNLAVFINRDSLNEISEEFMNLTAAKDSETDFNSSLYVLKYKLRQLIENEQLGWMSFI